jgi:phosphoglycolate phosphatase-like HAD superfamily hydrolase
VTVQLAFDRLPGLEDIFDVVITSDDTERHKPSPDPILAAIERLDASPANCAYVGDSPYDIRAAKAAGAYAVAVAWGGIHADDVLMREEPDAFVRHAEELLGVL